MKALINYEYSDAFQKVTGIETVPLRPYGRLDAPVACHADMLFCIIDDTVFCYEDYVLENSILPVLQSSGKNVAFVKKVCEKKYPHDVSLNVLVCGDKLFCNTKFAAREIVNFAEEKGYKIINVNQGYSACSTLFLDTGYAVTSDLGMARALENEGYCVHCISNECVSLKGYSCGFFGGASAALGNKVYLAGNGEQIKKLDGFGDFLESAGYFTVPFADGEISDFGGVKFI